MIVDLQIDVENADGERLDPAELVAGAKAAGLDGVLLTRGDDFGLDLAPYREAAADAGITVLRGAKIETDHGLVLCILPEDSETPDEGWAEQTEEGLYDAHQVIDAIEERGGVSVALRPYDRDVAHPMGDHVFSLQGLVACEVMTGGLTDIANDLALEAANHLRMPCVATGGNRGVEGLGTAATLFRTRVDSESELCDAIRSGECWSVTFSDAVPKSEPAEERSGGGRRGRGGRGRSGDRDGGRGGDRDGGRGGDRDGGRSRGGRRGGRGRGGGGGGGGGGDDRGNRRRGGRRGGRGRGGPKPDDIGNRAPPQRREVAEDIGNRIRHDDEEYIAEDIGNRLKPGESSPYLPPTEEVHIPDDIDDDIGNR